LLFRGQPNWQIRNDIVRANKITHRTNPTFRRCDGWTVLLDDQGGKAKDYE
jgi:hypothetical protein